MKFTKNDGGRAAAGFKGHAGDCVARAVTIASGLPYADVYAALSKGVGEERRTRGATARNGIRTDRKWFKDYMQSIGFEWTPTMKIGSGCKVHLNADELPVGRLVVSVSKHYTAVIDGVIHDTHDPSDRSSTIYTVAADEPPKAGWRYLRDTSNGRQKQYAYSPERCVYGYWTFAKAAA